MGIDFLSRACYTADPFGNYQFHLADLEPSVYEKDGKHLANLKVARGRISLVCKKNQTARWRRTARSSPPKKPSSF